MFDTKIASRRLLLAVAAVAATRPAFAAANDYEFRLVTNEVKMGEAVITVRLVHKASGRAVPNAVIHTTQLDMAPEGMPTMTTPLTAVPGGEPGTYSFRTQLVMAGGWALTLAARVQGEEGTVQGQLVLRATP